ncbi:hypothetical protein ACFJGV_00735 [Cnuibacter sp. UC19_7]|uniref:hypothetical protein n=1 Tax=Cnuibacter sp. UC19_7 TaxID=3350166 RepID=UPI00366EBB6B
MVEKDREMQHSTDVAEVSTPAGTTVLGTVGLTLAVVAPALGLIVSIIALLRARAHGSGDTLAIVGVVVAASAIVFAVALLWALSATGLIGFSVSTCVQGVDGCPVLSGS